MFRFALAVATSGAAAPLFANDYVPVSDESAFLSLMEGRELRLGMFGIALEVRPDGVIEGSASGWPVNGAWSWQDGFFCRELDWGGMEIPYNCQLVEVRGDSEIRFTVDQGAGQSAAFNLR